MARGMCCIWMVQRNWIQMQVHYRRRYEFDQRQIKFYLGWIMIKLAKPEDSMILAELALKLWEDNSLSEMAHEFEKLIASDTAVCFIQYVDGRAIGFSQCQLRSDYVEGTDSSPVGYLEGIFIEEAYRKRGYARELLKECENWAKKKHCIEFASDCELKNEDSLHFHMAMGFEEANRIICFRKDI